MSLPYIRRAYGVPAYRSGRVKVIDYGEGTITSGTALLYVRLDGQKHPMAFHPTWRVEYLKASKREGMPC